MQLEWLPATIIQRIFETRHAATLRLQLPAPMHFRAGQFIKIRVPVEGHELPLRRSYSIASSPAIPSDVIEITVSRAEQGRVSRVLVDEMETGTQVEVRGPQGRFVWNDDLEGDVLMVAGGSGIVPLMSMIRYIDDVSSSARVTLLYSCRTEQDVIYYEELNRPRPWLRVILAVTRAADASDRATTYGRRIDVEMLADLLPEALAAAFICGPPGLVNTAHTGLKELGVTSDRIHLEVFD